MRQSIAVIFAGTVVFGWTMALFADAAADQLANQIDAHVQASVGAISTVHQGNVTGFSQLAVTGSWSEIWPSGTRNVQSQIWNASIQKALDTYGAAYLPNRGVPYYLDNPIVLKSGQRLIADPQAEIRLKPGTNTCMVRNEHIINGQNGPIPANANPDTQILVQGGIWSTLATSYNQNNGNVQGWPVKQDTAITGNGVILMSNVNGVAVKDLVIRQSQAHGVQFSNCLDFLTEGITFDAHLRDGIHVNGPAAYGVIRDIRGVTADDFVALNAWDWKNTVTSFGSIDHVLVEDVHCNPQANGCDRIRLLPGTKTFDNGQKLACPVTDSVLRDLQNVKEIKIYDQPNGELGPTVDYSDPIGTVKNVYFNKLVSNSPSPFRIQQYVDGLSVDDVQLNFDLSASGNENFKLIELGPTTFSSNKNMTVQNVHLTNVRSNVGGNLQLLSGVEARLVQVANQKVKLLGGCLIPASVSNPSFEAGVGNSAAPTDWSYGGTVRACQETKTLGGLSTTAVGNNVMQLNIGDHASAYAYQNLPMDFIEGVTYTLTAAIGMRNDQIGNASYAQGEDWTLSFNYTDTGEEVARVSGSILNDALHTGFLTDQILSYTADATDASHGMQIRIFGSTVGKNPAVSGGLAYGLLSIDNVRMDGRIVPEPSALALLCSLLATLSVMGLWKLQNA
jgi:hypothetical protein